MEDKKSVIFRAAKRLGCDKILGIGMYLQFCQWVLGRVFVMVVSHGYLMKCACQHSQPLYVSFRLWLPLSKIRYCCKLILSINYYKALCIILVVYTLDFNSLYRNHFQYVKLPIAGCCHYSIFNMQV